MKILLAGLVVAAAVAAGFTQGPGQGSDEIAAAPSGDYLLVAGGSECELSKTGDVNARKLERFDADCGAMAGIASATHLVEHEDGSVDLVKLTGEPVIRFAAAEGGTHVSYEPRAPLVRLVLTD